MTIAVVIILVVLLGLSVIVAVARDPGPTPTDVAIGYGGALADRDFDAVYRMTDPDVLHGRNRPQWMAEQETQPRAAMLRSAVVARSMVVLGDEARVVLGVDDDGATAVVDLVMRQRLWVVVAFTPVAAPADQPP